MSTEQNQGRTRAADGDGSGLRRLNVRLMNAQDSVIKEDRFDPSFRSGRGGCRVLGAKLQTASRGGGPAGGQARAGPHPALVAM